VRKQCDERAQRQENNSNKGGGRITTMKAEKMDAAFHRVGPAKASVVIHHSAQACSHYGHRAK